MTIRETLQSRSSVCATLGKLLHSTLPHSTQLYKWVPGASWGAKVAIRSVGFSIVGFRWDSQVRHLLDWVLCPHPMMLLLAALPRVLARPGCEAWLPDAQAHSAKVALAYLAHICWGVVTSNGRSLDLRP